MLGRCDGACWGGVMVHAKEVMVHAKEVMVRAGEI